LSCPKAGLPRFSRFQTPIKKVILDTEKTMQVRIGVQSRLKGSTQTVPFLRGKPPSSEVVRKPAAEERVSITNPN
jgi:hypothetical protein